MHVTSVSNPRVKQWAQLRDKKGRDKHGMFLVEGVRLVNEALLSHARVECVIYSLERGIPAEIVTRDVSPDIEWIGVSEAVLAKCSDTITSQGVIAVVERWDDALEDGALVGGAEGGASGLNALQSILHTPNPLVLAVDGIQDPGNLGTIIRSADAVGATGIVIGKGSVDLYNPKVVRATMGSIFHLPIVEADLEVVLPLVRELGIEIVSTGLETEQDCYNEDFTKGKWIVVGNEGHGVSTAISRFVDRQIIIPMRGEAESLNVAMATTVILYEALRQRELPKKMT